MKAPSEENYDKSTRGKGHNVETYIQLVGRILYRFQTTVLMVAPMLQCYVRLSSVTLCIVAKRCVLQQSTVDLTDNL